jgi:dipeptidyl aminopeptidase/acylaminoacyl peptidase
MKEIAWLVGLFLFLTLVFGPVLVAQARGREKRTYQDIPLSGLEYTEVFFRNETQGLNLAGLLFLPDGRGPFPGVVIIHGSGTSARENRWYLSLVSALQENGIAVLLPDKRGSEKSEGDWRTSSYEYLAMDTLAAVDYYLKAQEKMNISHIGIIGMSQGGFYAPLVALQSPAVDFLVSVVGSSLDSYQTLHYEETNTLRQMGFLPGVADLIAYLSTFILKNLTQKDFWGAVGNFDPLPFWKELSIPALVMLGSEDTNVPAEASKARLDALNKENITVKIYAGSEHALQDPPGTGDRIFRQEALRDIENFIHGVVTSRQSLGVSGRQS